MKTIEDLGDIGLVSRCKKLEEELEIERMRLAACGVAAIGYVKTADDCHKEYQSASLDDVLSLQKRYGELSKKYEELLYAVAQKFPDETRHETALRYIRQREEGSDQCCLEFQYPI